ncbi:hypothetical protein OY671_007797, partial [Metschnikowia pulcherrima]
VVNLDFSPEELAFRDEVRAFIAENYPAQSRGKQDEGGDSSKEDFLSWHKVSAKKGWIAPAWPVEYGGPGWTATQRYIWSEETARADCIRIMPFGITMVGPVIYTFGTPEQKARFSPRILSGEDWWCQGYSEPGSGSDLASSRTRAVSSEAGSHYIVNGQKTWTTMAQHADWGFFSVRTNPDAKQQEGISFSSIDMASPGVQVRPIITSDGEHEVNEVFFSDVRVPVENSVGEENRGWTCAKYSSTYERTNIAGVGQSTAASERSKTGAASQKKNGRPSAEDPDFAARSARVEIESANMRTTNSRVVAAVAGGGAPGAESSMLKIRGTQIRQ